MFDPSKIQTALTGLVGIRQPLNPDYDVLLPASYIATSGLYLDDVEHFRFEYWKDNQSFSEADAAGLQTKWAELEKSAIANVIASIFNRPDYIDRNLMFSNTFDRNELITLNTSSQMFHGYEIEISDRKNIAFVISNVRVEAQGAGEMTINLYHSSQEDPIKTITFDALGDGQLQVVPLDWYIDMSDNYYKGTFLLGFTYPEFDYKPFARNYERASCMNNIAELCIRSVQKLGSLNSLEDFENTSDHNGLNFDITVYEDFTDLIVKNARMFAKAIQLQWVTSVLLSAISTNRANREQRVSSDIAKEIYLVVEGSKEYGVRGLKSYLAGELKRLNEIIHTAQDGYFVGILSSDTMR